MAAAQGLSAGHLELLETLEGQVQRGGAAPPEGETDRSSQDTEILQIRSGTESTVTARTAAVAANVLYARMYESVLVDSTLSPVFLLPVTAPSVSPLSVHQSSVRIAAMQGLAFGTEIHERDQRAPSQNLPQVEGMNQCRDPFASSFSFLLALSST